MKRKLHPLIFVSLGLFLLSGCRLVDISEPELPITNFFIFGVTAPQAGEIPVRALDADQYRGRVEWSPPVESVFSENVEYTAIITLRAKSGYSLAGVPHNRFQVLGAWSINNAADSGIVRITFPSSGTSTGGGQDHIINIFNLPVDLIPKTGDAPFTFFTASNQYTANVFWYNGHDPESDPMLDDWFAPSSLYTAVIMFTARSGYTFQNVNWGDFKIPGDESPMSSQENPPKLTIYFAETDGEEPPGPGSGYVSSNIGNLEYVPPGSFQRDDNAANISEITGAYRMSRHQITRGQFEAIMGTDPSNIGSSSSPHSVVDPVQSVSWYHAIAFCNKLSLAEGLTPFYSVEGVNDWQNLPFNSIPTDEDDDWNKAAWVENADGYRLPTVMEWLWAAMGAPQDGQDGNINTTGYTKAFAGSTGSNNIIDYVWHSGNVNNNKTQIVGQKLENELGLFDMSGNVNEWCWDWLEDPASLTGTVTDHRGPNTHADGARAYRGGSFRDSPPSFQLIFSQLGQFIQYQEDYVGFRVVRP